MEKLYCHTTLFVNGDYTDSPAAVEGKTYKIVNEGQFYIEFINEQGITHTLTVEPDSEGLSYRTWFDIKDTDNAGLNFKFITIEGVVYKVKGDMDEQEFNDAFIEFVESKGWYFGGRTILEATKDDEVDGDE